PPVVNLSDWTLVRTRFRAIDHSTAVASPGRSPPAFFSPPWKLLRSARQKRQPERIRVSLAGTGISSVPKRKIVAKTEKLTPIGKSIVAGLKEAIAHVRGEITLPTRAYLAVIDRNPDLVAQTMTVAAKRRQGTRKAAAKRAVRTRGDRGQ